MNYLNIYQSLVTKRQNILIEGYTEKHHIIPKSLGGSNRTDNLVHLTAREHFIAHQLLVKIYPDNRKLSYAVVLMSNNKRYNSKRYEWLKRLHSEIMVDTMTGKKFTEETKHRMSIASKGKPKTEETKQKMRKPKSELVKQKISQTLTGVKHSDERKQKNADGQRGTKRSEECKQKMRESQQRRRALEDKKR